MRQTALASVAWAIAQVVMAGHVPQETTTWDGVYTPQQAARGDVVYGRRCRHCHQDDLSGGADSAPDLRGQRFLERWQRRPLLDLYRVVADTMPEDAPGSLARQDVADVLAFVLRKNLMPAGDTELPADQDTLRRIVLLDRPRQP